MKNLQSTPLSFGSPNEFTLDLLPTSEAQSQVAESVNARVRPTRRADLSAYLSFLIIALFFTWTALSDHIDWRYGQRQKDYYNLLTEGFLSGHLWLNAEPSPALLACTDPYDPALRPEGSGLHDASLFGGHYYIYFGVVPALLLFLPFRLLTGVALPMGAAVLTFSLLGCGIAILLLSRVCRDHFPKLGGPTRFLIFTSYGLSSSLPIHLRRHSLYELPIAGASAFNFAALACLFFALRPGASYRRWAVLKDRKGVRLPLTERTKVFVLASLPLLAAGVGLGVYNYLRFGDFTETGHRYQLSGLYEAKITQFPLTSFWENTVFYFLSIGKWTPGFPFYRPLPVIREYGGDFGFCLLLFVPLLWFVPTLVFPRLREAALRPNELTALLLGFAWTGISQLTLLLSFFFVSIRYLGDFAPYWVFLGCLGCLHFLSWSSELSRAGRFACSFLILSAAVFSCFTNVAASITVYGRIEEFNPEGYKSLERVANAIAFMGLSKTPAESPNQ